MKSDFFCLLEDCGDGQTEGGFILYWVSSTHPLNIIIVMIYVVVSIYYVYACTFNACSSQQAAGRWQEKDNNNIEIQLLSTLKL